MFPLPPRECHNEELKSPGPVLFFFSAGFRSPGLPLFVARLVMLSSQTGGKKPKIYFPPGLAFLRNSCRLWAVCEQVCPST